MSSHCYLTNFILTNYNDYYKIPYATFNKNVNVTSQSDELLRHATFYVTVCTPVVAVVLTCYLLYFLHDLLFVPINRVRLLEENGYQLDKTKARNWMDCSKLNRKRRKVGEKLPPVYPNGWFQLTDSLFVGKGQVKEVCALGEHFAVYRTTKGKVHVLDAYCPHMGSNLAVGGLVKGDCLQCPFHGWTFDGNTGDCVKIPYTDKIPKTARTRSWTSKEVNGGIFVWYHCDGESPSWDFPQIEEIHGGKFKYKGRVEHHTNTHIQDIPENGSDLAHLSFLHKPNVMSGVDLSKTQDNFWNIVQHIFTVDPVGTSEEEPHISKFFLRHYLLLLNKIEFLDLRFTVYQIGPGLVHLHFTSSIGEGVFVQTLTPVEPLHQVLVHRLYTNWKIPMFVGKIMLALEAIQVDRDVMVWNNKTFMQNPMLVKQEKLISQFRRWYSQFYSDNSPTLQSLQAGNDTLDW